MQQQAGQERVFLAQGLVGDDGDLTLAWRGDEGDDPAPLEKAEEAPTRTLDDGKDVLLGKSRRRVEDERTDRADRGQSFYASPPGRTRAVRFCAGTS